MFRFPELSDTESEIVSRIDNNEPLYVYVTDRAEDLVKQRPNTHKQRMRAVERLARNLRESVLPEIAGPFTSSMRADLIAEHFLAVASKDLE